MNDTVPARTGGCRRLSPPALGLLAILAAGCLSSPAALAGKEVGAYVQRNLVSDGGVPAEHVDPELINPWGIALTATGMVWIASNGNSGSSVYDGLGNPLHSPSLAVDIPGGSPTGIASNEGADFALPCPDGTVDPAVFIFATEAGVISGWSYRAGETKAIAMVDNSQGGAVYKGVAIAANGNSRFLYATDFHGGKIDVFDNVFQPVTLPAGAFKDPSLPAGFAPFGIHNINGNLYVTYAKQDSDKEDGVAGAGMGFVNIFNADGRLVRRLASRGHLNAPWGMAMAPADFGPFSNHLLVANVGDGKINAYDPASGEFKGEIRGTDSRPLAIDGLWGICFGNGVRDQPTNALFFTAGPAGANHGLYGRIERADGLLAAGRAAPLQTQPGEQPLGGAKAGEPALQKVKASEGGDGEKPLRNEDGALLDAQGQGQQDNAAGQDTNGTLNIHAPKTPD
ncbi:MAG: hypothetical protein H6R10_3034 [Rhodocyclaceae bacterium]|nr:hypothetical protein [Rhodocyclaceae bacterium]